jgi:hypothetical protein
MARLTIIDRFTIGIGMVAHLCNLGLGWVHNKRFGEKAVTGRNIAFRLLNLSRIELSKSWQD